MTKKKIIVIGSSNTDMVIKSSHLPAPGETILGGTFLMNAGGKGANQAVAAARQDGDVLFIAKVGNDVFGKGAIELFNAEGIDTRFIFTDEQNPSGVALITVDAHGENCIVVASGANGTLSTADIAVAKTEVENASIVLLQLEIPIDTVEYAAALAHKKGIPVVLNPAPARILSDDLLRCLYAITPNEHEAEFLSGIKVIDEASARMAADVISKRGVENVVITMGAQGAFIKAKETYTIVSAVKVAPLDTTAAGDSFSGAFCVGLAEGKTIVESVQYATRVAAITVTRMGAQSSIPYKSEL